MLRAWLNDAEEPAEITIYEELNRAGLITPIGRGGATRQDVADRSRLSSGALLPPNLELLLTA